MNTKQLIMPLAIGAAMTTTAHGAFIEFENFDSVADWGTSAGSLPISVVADPAGGTNNVGQMLEFGGQNGLLKLQKQTKRNT